MKDTHTLPADIERTSMEIIAEELVKRGVVLPRQTEAVIKRVIHTTADFDYAENLKFTADAVEKGAEALRRGSVIVADTNMIKAGLHKPSITQLHSAVHCFMADADVAQTARKNNTTRAVAAMEKAAREFPFSIYVVGNAPTALMKIAEMIENGLRPPLIIGVPVGFVNVVESKECISAICRKYKIPAIVAQGRKGGSTVAVAICNALLFSATGRLDPETRA